MAKWLAGVHETLVQNELVIMRAIQPYHFPGALCLCRCRSVCLSVCLSLSRLCLSQSLSLFCL